MHTPSGTPRANLQLALGTISFPICFAAWGLISAFAPRFREAFQLTATQTAFLVAVPVLLGALMRIATGMLADRWTRWSSSARRDFLWIAFSGSPGSESLSVESTRMRVTNNLRSSSRE
jgi:MFS family permease